MLNTLLNFELDEAKETVEQNRFKIENLDGCNFAFRKLNALEKRIGEYRALRMAEILRINDWYDKEVEKIENQESFFNGLLTEYAIEQRRIDPKFKVSTPFGKVNFRKQQPKWNMEEEILLHNLKSSGLDNLIRVKEEINKAELKKAVIVVNGNVLIDGEIIEGVTVEEQPEAIKIEVAE